MSRERPWRDAREVLLDAALVVGVTAVAVVLVFGLWDASLRIPFVYVGDGISQLSITKTILQHGWYQDNPLVGYPFGQHWGDYPLGSDNAHWLLVKALGVLSKDAALVTNLYFLLGFPLCALSAFFVVRYLGVSRWPALVAAQLFAFLPYHFVRNVVHLPLGAYWSVPIACLLIVLVQRDPPPLFRRTPDGLRIDVRSRRTVGFLAGALVIGSTGSNYSLFFMVLVLSVAVVRAVATRELVATLGSVVVICSVVVGALLLNNAPSLLYQRANGRNDAVANRVSAELDSYALRPVQLLMPISDHRVGLLDKVSDRALNPSMNAENKSQMGTFAALGFLTLVIGAFSVLVGRRRTVYDELPSQLAVPTLVAVLFGVVGGFSWSFAVLGFNEVRAWGRLVVFIAFFSLTALAWWLDVLVRRVAWLRMRPAIVAALALVLVTVGILDQTSPATVPNATQWEASYRSDARFVAAVERAVPTGTPVFQLPYLPFPESESVLRPYGMADYDPLRGFLHSDTLRWGYGGMRGRDGDWQQAVSARAPREVLEAISAVGFRGLWIDRLGYADRAEALVEQYQALLGETPLESDDGRFVFFPLARYAADQRTRLGARGVEALRRSVLRTPQLVAASGVTETAPGTGATRVLTAPEAVFVVDAASDAAEPVRVQGTVQTRDGGEAMLTITLGDQRRRVRIGGSPMPLDVGFTLPPGSHELRVEVAPVSGVPSADGGVVLDDLAVRPGS